MEKTLRELLHSCMDTPCTASLIERHFPAIGEFPHQQILFQEVSSSSLRPRRSSQRHADSTLAHPMMGLKGIVKV